MHTSHYSRLEKTTSLYRLPPKKDYTTYILHVVPITTHTHTADASQLDKRNRKEKKIKERKEKTKKAKKRKRKGKKRKDEKSKETQDKKREQGKDKRKKCHTLADPRN